MSRLVSVTLAIVLLVVAVPLAASPRGAQAQTASHPVCGPNPKVMAVNESYTRAAEPIVFAGVVKEGATRDVLQEITGVAVAPAGAGLAASFTASSFTLAAAAGAEGKAFTVTVSYKVQPQKYVKVTKHTLGWVNDGAPQIRTCQLTVVVKLRPLAELVVKVGETVNVPLAGDAAVYEVDPANPYNVYVSIAAGVPAVQGKRVGKQSLTLKYRIGTHQLEAPLKVEVVSQGASVEVQVMVGETKQVDPDAVKLENLPTGKFTEPVTVANPAISSAKAHKGAVLVTGKKEGKTTAVADYVVTEGEGAAKKTFWDKVTLKITVVPVPRDEDDDGGQAPRSVPDGETGASNPPASPRIVPIAGTPVGENLPEEEMPPADPVPEPTIVPAAEAVAEEPGEGGDEQGRADPGEPIVIADPSGDGTTEGNPDDGNADLVGEEPRDGGDGRVIADSIGAGQPDPDGDGEPEVVTADATLAPGGIRAVDTDRDNDLDEIAVGTQGGGRIVGTADPDGDGDEDIIVEDPTLPPGGFRAANTDGDTDNDIFWIGTQGGGQVVGIVDLDGDGDKEIVVEDPTLPAGGTRAANTDTDLDNDIIWIGTQR